MSQPPYGDAQPPDPESTPYPQQELLPQQVKPGRSRLPLLIGALALAVVVVGGLVAWWLLRDDGEQNRAAYCDAVRKLTSNGDLGAAASGDLSNAPAALSHARDLAPSAVRTQWDDIVALVPRLSTGQVDVATGLRVVSDLRVIVDDANAKCGMDIQAPF